MPLFAKVLPREDIGRSSRRQHRLGPRAWRTVVGSACLAGLVAVAGPQPPRAAAAEPATVNPPAIEQDRFGTTIDGTAVDRYTLRNARGMMVRLIKHGATGTELWAPDRPGIEHARLAGGAAQDPGRTGCAVHLPQPRRRPGIPGHARRGRGLHPHPEQRVADRVSSDDRSPQSVGGPRAGETGGGSSGSPRCVRIFRIGPGSVMNGISRTSPPHTGHSRGNSSPTRAMSLAQAIRDVSCEPGFWVA